MCQWYDTENLVLTPRGSGDEEQVDLHPAQLPRMCQKTAENATHSRRLDVTTR